MQGVESEIRVPGDIAAHGLLERIRTGVAVVNGGAELVYANASARELLDKGDAVRLSAGRVVGRGWLDGALLERVQATGQACVQVANADHSRTLLIVGDPGPGVGQTTLWLIEPETSAPDCSWVGRMFKLTQAERRVVDSLASGASTEEAADALEISIATLRTHLQRIYAKLGVRNQAGLVRLAHLRPCR